MSNVNVSSILIESRKRLQSAGGAEVTQSTSGIDFANDTVLVSAANELMSAQEFEYSMNAIANDDRLNVEHLNDDFLKTLSQYQAVLNMEQLARNSAEELSIVHSSVLQQLVAANQNVATLEAQRNNAANEVTMASEQLSLLRQEKTQKILMHNDKIDGYNSEILGAKQNISDCERSINKSNSNIANAKTQINSLTSALSLALMPEEKAAIQQQIDNLKAQIRQEEANIELKRQQISSQNDKIAHLEQMIADEENAKSVTIASLDEKISIAEADLEKKENSYNAINEQLANAVYTQTGLTLQEAESAFKVQEAQIYLQSVSDLLKILSFEMSKIEEQQIAAQDELSVSQNNENIASERTMQLEVEYNADVEVAIQKRQQNKGKNIFLG